MPSMYTHTTVYFGVKKIISSLLYQNLDTGEGKIIALLICTHSYKTKAIMLNIQQLALKANWWQKTQLSTNYTNQNTKVTSTL